MFSAPSVLPILGGRAKALHWFPTFRVLRHFQREVIAAFPPATVSVPKHLFLRAFCDALALAYRYLKLGFLCGPKFCCSWPLK